MQVPWNEQRERVFLDRYALKDKAGKVLELTPNDMFRRVAKAVAENLQEEEQFYRVMSGWKFIPGGRILSGAGNGHQVTYFNCFVIPVKANDPSFGNDSRAAIMDTIAAALEINSRGGGVGINWSVLRPRGTYVRGVGGTSSGSVSWMLAANEVAAQVEQGGTRRAALMFMLWDWHPDIEEFITIKKDLNKMQHANLSVCVSDAFMKAVQSDEMWRLEFPDTTHEKYDQEWDGDLARWKNKGCPVKTYKELPARELWNKICRSAWECGEPGVVFLERYNNEYNAKYCSQIVATNPCGELGLEPYGVCNLGAINLVAFYKDGEVDFKDLAGTVATAVTFLDRIIDLNPYFLDANMEQSFRLRRVGLGVMGLADLLILLGIRYGSQQAVATTRHIMQQIAVAAYGASVELAKEYGPFPAFDAYKYMQSPFIRRLPKEVQEHITIYGIRNATLLAQAPTGTTSILAGVSSGIEPNFSKEYIRRDRIGEHLVRHWLADNPAFVCAHEVTPEEHVHTQAAVQEWVDSSVSKTVNLPNTASVDDIRNIYELAYNLGCKGITVYRDGSREGVLIAASKTSNPPQKATRPSTLTGFTKRVETPVGRVYITVNFLDNKPFEVFAGIGKAGSDIAAFAEAIARLVSLALRSGLSPEEVVDQLRGIGGTSSVGFGPNRISSVPDAIGRVLQELSEETKTPRPQTPDICPKCGVAALVLGEGCAQCQNCGYSRC